MEQSVAESEKFSFGQVTNTEYVTYEVVDTQNRLPYHPFLFDLNLVIFRTKPTYEDVGTEYLLSRDQATIFGRKKKQPKDWKDLDSVPYYLKAETVSGRHFRIDGNYNLRDEGSKHGTFVWVSRQHPRKIFLNDVYLVAKHALTILRAVHLPRPSIEIGYKGETFKISEHQKLFLIGSHRKCDLVIEGLHHFEICINVSTFTILNHLDEEEASADHGLWFKLRQKQEVPLQHGSLILVDPYIFKITS